MRKKKIVFFMFGLAGGGAERTVINIINNMNFTSFEVVLVVGTNNRDDYSYLIKDEVQVISLNKAKLRYCFRAFIKVIRKIKPDLIFTTVNPNNIFVLISKLFGFVNTPVIIRESNTLSKRTDLTYKQRVMTTLFYNVLATKIVSLSVGVKDDLVNNFKINPKKIEVIYNPVEVSLIKKLAKENLEDKNVRKNVQKIISVGRLTEQKDFPTLIKAFSVVNKEIDSQLIILGKGTLEVELKRLTKKLGIENDVYFAGFQSNPYQYINVADTFVLSSKWEGFGHVIVEAMASGTPVVSTNCQSGPAEIIRRNEYGILVEEENNIEMADKILNLLNNKKQNEHYSMMGSKRANDFDVKKIVLKYEKLFESIL